MYLGIPDKITMYMSMHACACARLHGCTHTCIILYIIILLCNNSWVYEEYVRLRFDYINYSSPKLKEWSLSPGPLNWMPPCTWSLKADHRSKGLSVLLWQLKPLGCNNDDNVSLWVELSEYMHYTCNILYGCYDYQKTIAFYACFISLNTITNHSFICMA